AQPFVRALPLFGEIAAFGAGLGAVLIATLLFPGVVTALVGIFLEDVAAAVEARHYPGLPPPRDIPLSEALGTSLQLAAVTVGLNILLLPLYLVLLFLPPLNLVVFYAVNGRLLGREYFESVALRRMNKADGRALAARHAGTLWGTGAITALLLTIPLLNMAAPVIGAAAMVHIFQKLTRST
ncbi:MAG: EI24 domain-containing protein, partial [Rhodospirillaceae bacterium]|nr:EI24 domain-containing protein [Rhodospirillaceae bacterium]